MDLEIKPALLIGMGVIVFDGALAYYIYSLKGYRKMYIDGSNQKRFFCCVCKQEKAVSSFDGFIPTKHLENPAAFVYETIARRQEPPLHGLVCPPCQIPQLAATVASGYFPVLGQKKSSGKVRALDKRLSAHLKLKGDIHRSSLLVAAFCLGLMVYIAFGV